MKHSSMSDYDVDVIPMVEYFNSVGLKTYMSCSGHKDNPYMSMFWIEFDPSVTEQDIIDFQQQGHFRELSVVASSWLPTAVCIRKFKSCGRKTPNANASTLSS